MPEDFFNKIMLYSISHPVAELFKKELEEELSEHYRIREEGPPYNFNWSHDDDLLVGYRTLVSKLTYNNKELQWTKLHVKYGWVD